MHPNLEHDDDSDGLEIYSQEFDQDTPMLKAEQDVKRAAKELARQIGPAIAKYGPDVLMYAIPGVTIAAPGVGNKIFGGAVTGMGGLIKKMNEEDGLDAMGNPRGKHMDVKKAALEELAELANGEMEDSMFSEVMPKEEMKKEVSPEEMVEVEKTEVKATPGLMDEVDEYIEKKKLGMEDEE